MLDTFQRIASDTSLASQIQAVAWMEMHLGTVVEIGCHAASEMDARAAVAAAFEEVALIHRLMSFHDENSDVSRLNSRGAREAVMVNPRTIDVIRTACEISRLSEGHFDITVAPELVRAGHLPRAASACEPRSGATWRDISILAENAVAFRQPLWIDLGGIAKGYAVDRAFSICSALSGGSCLVNAGGDARVSDDLTGAVCLDVPDRDARQIPRVELSGGSIASSCGRPAARLYKGVMTGPHIDGVSRVALDPRRFVSVLAESCMIADALTKVVLATSDIVPGLLGHYGATALVYDQGTGWRQLP